MKSVFWCFATAKDSNVHKLLRAWRHLCANTHSVPLTGNQDYLIETSVDEHLPWHLLPETPHLQISCFILWRSSGSALSSFLTWSCSSTLFWWLGGRNSPPRRFALDSGSTSLSTCWRWIISVFIPVNDTDLFWMQGLFWRNKGDLWFHFLQSVARVSFFSEDGCWKSLSITVKAL